MLKRNLFLVLLYTFKSIYRLQLLNRVIFPKSQRLKAIDRIAKSLYIQVLHLLKTQVVRSPNLHRKVIVSIETQNHEPPHNNLIGITPTHS